MLCGVLTVATCISDLIERVEVQQDRYTARIKNTSYKIHIWREQCHGHKVQ